MYLVCSTIVTLAVHSSRLFYYSLMYSHVFFFFFFQAEDGIRDLIVTGVQTCALPIYVVRHAFDLLDDVRRDKRGGEDRALLFAHRRGGRTRGGLRRHHQ